MLCLTSIILAGCGGGSAEEASYEKAIENYRASGRAAVSVAQDIRLSDGSTVMTSKLYGLLQVENPNGEKTSASMQSTGITLNLGGEDMELIMNTYYKDSTLYTSFRGNNYAKECDWKTAEAEIGPFAAPLSGVEAEDFQKMEKTDEENQSVYNFEITGENAGKIPGIREQWNRMAESYGSDSEIAFQSASGQLIVGSNDNLPQEEVLTVTGTIQAGERAIQVTEELKLSFAYGEIVNVEIPDVSSYQKISN